MNVRQKSFMGSVVLSVLMFASNSFAVLDDAVIRSKGLPECGIQKSNLCTEHTVYVRSAGERGSFNTGRSCDPASSGWDRDTSCGCSKRESVPTWQVGIVTQNYGYQFILGSDEYVKSKFFSNDEQAARAYLSDLLEKKLCR